MNKVRTFCFYLVAGFLLVTFLLSFRTFGYNSLKRNNQKVLLIDSIKDNYSLENYLYYLPDSSEKYTINDLENGRLDSLFSPNKNVTNNVTNYWIRFRIETLLESDTEWLLHYPGIQTELYQPEEHGFKAKKSGFNIPVDERSYKSLMSVIDVHLNNKSITGFYMKVCYDFGVSAENIKLSNPKATISWLKKELIWFTAILAILLVLSLYNMVLFFLIKDKSYLFYSVFILFLGFYFWGRDANSAIYFIELRYWKTYYLSWVFSVPFVVIFYIYFSRYYLNTKKHFPKWDKILFLFQIIFLIDFIIILITCLFTGILNSSVFRIMAILGDIEDVVVLIMFIVYIIFGIRAWRTRYLPARYFFIANAIFIGFTIIYLLTGLNVLSVNEFTDRSLDIGLVVLLILFAIALAAKYNHVKSKLFEERVRREKLERQRAEELEIKVKERTIQLREANEELHQTNDELNSALEIVHKQKSEIENAHKHIQDSINYASRIQSAVLPENILDKSVVNHFIFFKPRDIVSGDFYWMKEDGKYIIIATADCTGHGVPGAFMSMLGIVFLNEVVNRQNAKIPGQILNELRNKVKISLKQTGKEYESKEGMDIAIYAINKETNVLFYSGAHNPLYLIRNSTLPLLIDNAPDKTLEKQNSIITMKNDIHTLYNIKGNRQPVGIHMKELPFVTIEIQLQKGDCLYTFSDGFVDQLGGNVGRKFMTKNFKQLLLTICKRPMPEQKQILNKTLINWIGDIYKQVDDILVIGVEV